MCTQATNCRNTFSSLPSWLATAWQQLKDKTVLLLVCVFTEYKFVVRKKESADVNEWIEIPQHYFFIIMDVVEVGAIIGLVAWNRKKHRQHQF